MSSTVRRRSVLGYGAGAAGALAAGGPATAAHAAPGASPQGSPRRRRAGRRVAVFGAGPAGLTVAHELAERGFEVTVYERRNVLGGKARSIPVPGTGTKGRRDLPGEHGHRGVFGFYHNLPDTLRRIPFRGNAHGVHDNLVRAAWVQFARTSGRQAIDIPGTPLGPGTLDPEAVIQLLAGLAEEVFHLPPWEAALGARKLVILMTSGKERRFGQWEYENWWKFIEAEGKSADYRRLLGGGVQVIQALKPTSASARTCGQGGEAIVWDLLQLGSDGPNNRVFNAPTSEAWIDPWGEHLRSLGVTFQTGHSVESLVLSGGRISGAMTRDPGGRTVPVDADHYVVAVPVDRAVRLWSPELLAAEPRLKATKKLNTTWSQGIQYYLTHPVHVVPGHVAYPDSPWSLVSVSQSQFWHEEFTTTWGDGDTRDSFSVVISNWDEPGVLYGKPARRCTPRQIAAEVWAQMKQALNRPGLARLTDDNLRTWFLDPAITQTGGAELANEEPYLLNDAGSWDHRPDTTTAIPNLFLAADYVRQYSNVDFSSMEAANEAGRRAANAILDAAGATEPKAQLFARYEPEELDAAKRLDTDRYRRGLPHVLDF
ncbi:FAD-dependent oxidoreductase [Streptomyces sp. NBRC 110611]|uniref:hydroxysqualene dehydroxylase n=1 Tax=Streptomyces sp. NBRC 110611 TaxID=1621259 RepID=UPI00083027E8|nr:FAD-dependent oxidoreductase [Streptomyces sp. NBRC 110611]